ncbi:reverse transcriptase domain-containing protein [Tanacetum coccineum]
MQTTRQGMNCVEIEQIVAQRVANAIESIDIYETKIRMVHDSMDHVVCQGITVAENANNKRKWGNDHARNSGQQQNKRHEVVRAHTSGPGNKKGYAGTLPNCDRCKLHHIGPCTVKCNNCKRVGQMTRYCKTPVLIMTQRSPVTYQKPKVTCYECEKSGHYKSDCIKLKNQNCVNQVWKVKARGNSNIAKYNVVA